MVIRRGGIILSVGCVLAAWAFFLPEGGKSQTIDLVAHERGRVVASAARYLADDPVTIVDFPCARSAGGLHDYYSEGDYWWPDPNDSSAPYIQRDGLTNPENFVAHRQALIRFSVQEATLATAYRITGEEKFAAHAIRHLKAWFVNPDTRMAPHLQFAQAIRGRVKGRGIGIIDTIHLIDVAKSIGVLRGSASLDPEDLAAIRRWFAEYLHWLTTSQYGTDESNARNNHGTCWVLQVAAYAEVVVDDRRLEDCRRRYREVLLPTQMAPDGRFPLELARTKPYGYSLFNLDAFAAICQLLSGPQDDLFAFTLPDGRGLRKAMEWVYPYLEDKSLWPFARDVMYFDAWPVRQPALLFAAVAFHEPKYLDLWKTLDADPSIDEVVRNFPLRQPVLWYHVGGR